MLNKKIDKSSLIKILQVIILITFISLVSIVVQSCGGESKSETQRLNDSIVPPDRIGTIGRYFENEDEFNEVKNNDDVVASVGKKIREIYYEDQFSEDAKVLLLSNSLPNEVVLKIDNPVVKENMAWEIVTARLLYREALEAFKMFDEEYKEHTMEMLEQDAKNQFMILQTISLPIKTYQPNTDDKIAFYEDKKEIFEIWGFEDYTQIPNFYSDYVKHYLEKVNDDYIAYLNKAYEYDINQSVVDNILDYTQIDAILNSEYSDQTILTINGKEISVREFAYFLMMQLSLMNANTMRTVSLTQGTLEVEIEMLFQNFIRFNLLKEDFAKKSKDYNENIMKRFINLFVESRVADAYIRMTVDRVTPPPIGNEVSEYFAKNETEIRNYFWRNFPDIANSMEEEEREEYIKNTVAEMYLRDRLIADEQIVFRNSLLKKYDHKPNKKTFEKNLIRYSPFDENVAKNPRSYLDSKSY